MTQLTDEGVIRFVQQALADRLCAFALRHSEQVDRDEIRYAWGRLLISPDQRDNVGTQFGLHGTSCAATAIMLHWLDQRNGTSGEWHSSRFRPFVVGAMHYLRAARKTSDQIKTLKLAEVLSAEILWAKCENLALSDAGVEIATALHSGRIASAWSYRCPRLGSSPPFELSTIYVAEALELGFRLGLVLPNFTTDDVGDCIAWLHRNIFDTARQALRNSEEGKAIGTLYTRLLYRVCENKHLAALHDTCRRNLLQTEEWHRAELLDRHFDIKYQLLIDQSDQTESSAFCTVPVGLLTLNVNCYRLAHDTQIRLDEKALSISKSVAQIMQTDLSSLGSVPSAIEALIFLRKASCSLAPHPSDVAVPQNKHGSAAHPIGGKSGLPFPTRRRLAAAGLVTAGIGVLYWLMRSGQPSPTQGLQGGGRNQTVRRSGWIKYRNGAQPETPVVVFVHGLQRDTGTDVFEKTAEMSWPVAIGTDVFGKSRTQVHVFLVRHGGTLFPGDYKIEHLQGEVFADLEAKKDTTNDVGPQISVLSHNNIIFVCHSLGGIVIRDLLAQHQNHSLLQGKNVGLVLLASPTSGSEWAKILGTVKSQTKIASELAPNGAYLQRVNAEFETLLRRSDRPFHISGQELFETRSVATGTPLVVARGDTRNFFPDLQSIPDTDHFTIAHYDDQGANKANEYVRHFIDSFVDRVMNSK